MDKYALFQTYRICSICGGYIRGDIEAHLKTQKHLDAVKLLDKLGQALIEVIKETQDKSKGESK